MRTNKIIYLLIFLQFFIIFTILFIIYNKKHNILGNYTIISPIDKQLVEKKEKSNLKYYWELPENEIVKFTLPTGEIVENTHNLDGFNETKDYSISKEIDVYRIITMGDSFTYGEGINTKDNWTELLENKLNEKKICKNINKFEVINLGVRGYDIEYSIERFKQKGQKYNPDLVIWTLVDIKRINEERFVFINDCENIKKIDIEKCFSKSDDQIATQDINTFIPKLRNSLFQFTQVYKNKIMFIDFFNNHQRVIQNYPRAFFIQNMDSILKNNLGANNVYIEKNGHPNNASQTTMSNIIYDKILENNQFFCQPLVQK